MVLLCDQVIFFLWSRTCQTTPFGKQISKISLEGILEKTQAIGGGGTRVMWQNEKNQNLGNHQCDVGQIAYFFSLGSLISKMET